MSRINKVILIGNATRDAELWHTASGKAVSSIRLATNRLVHGQEETQYHSVDCWEGLAETTSKYVKKDDPLYVEGRLQYRSFQDEEGKERGVCEIVANDVPFLGRKRTETAPSLTEAGVVTTPQANARPDTDTVHPDKIPF